MTCPTLWKCLEQSIQPWWGTHPGGHCRNPDQGCGESVERCSCLEFLAIVSVAAEKRRQTGSLGHVPTLLSGQQAGLRSTGWGPGSGDRRAGLLRLRGRGQRERTELAPEFKENCWELFAELKPVISPLSSLFDCHSLRPFSNDWVYLTPTRRQRSSSLGTSNKKESAFPSKAASLSPLIQSFLLEQSPVQRSKDFQNKINEHCIVKWFLIFDCIWISLIADRLIKTRSILHFKNVQYMNRNISSGVKFERNWKEEYRVKMWTILL